MANEIKTMAIPALLREVEETGLITDDSLKAFEAEKLQALEKIENLRRLHREKEISEKQMNARISAIQQEIQNKALPLDDDTEILH